MFTGLVEEMGTMKAMKKGAQSAQLSIAAEKTLEDINLGDSIAVNGVCLTVVDYTADTFVVDVMEETLRKTTLGKLVKGEQVNLERALTIGSRFGGHFVSGHIDGVGKILEQQWVDIALLARISVSDNLLPFIIEKGSIAIDGVSLTVIETGDGYFSTSLIPHTREKTTLGKKILGDSVNLETDILGKYIWKMLTAVEIQKKKSKVDYAFLEQHGFI